MITKERLEELIKKEATIYYIFDDIIFNTKEIIPIKLNDGASFDITTAFETKEDAEFALRFKRIPRTEFLDLPTWGEIEGDCSLEFDNFALRVNKLENRILILTNRDILGLYDCIFVKTATPKNYLEACEICRKLWLGEEV